MHAATAPDKLSHAPPVYKSSEQITLVIIRSGSPGREHVACARMVNNIILGVSSASKAISKNNKKNGGGDVDDVLKFLKEILPTSSSDDLAVLQQAIYYIHDLRGVLSSGDKTAAKSESGSRVAMETQRSSVF